MRRAASSLSRSSAAVGRLGRAAVVAVAVAALGGLGVAVSESTRTARAAPYRVLLASNRDGLFRGYSVRSDGSGLAPLLPRSRALAPVTVSGDGRTVAYVDPRKGHASGIYASRADGTDLRRVVAPRAGAPALSHDGRFLAFSKPGSPGIWIVGTDGRGARRLTRRADEGAQWSPDGKALVFLRSVGDYTQAIVVQPLRGTRRVIGYGDVYGLAWSPDGRWIAYSREEGDNLETPLWLVRPDGTGRRRVARDAGAVAWSPDGRTLALVSGRRLVVVGGAGRRRRTPRAGPSPGPVAIGGKLVAWLWTSLTGNHMETNEITSAGEFFDTAAISRGDSVGTVDLPPVGNGGVVAFAMQETCDSNASPGDRFACPPDFETGDVVA